MPGRACTLGCTTPGINVDTSAFLFCCCDEGRRGKEEFGPVDMELRWIGLGGAEGREDVLGPVLEDKAGDEAEIGRWTLACGATCTRGLE